MSDEAKGLFTKQGGILREYRHLPDDLEYILSFYNKQYNAKYQRRPTRYTEGLVPEVDTGDGILKTIDTLVLVREAESPEREPVRKIRKREDPKPEMPPRLVAWVDPAINVALYKIFADASRLIMKPTPVTVAKVKTEGCPPAYLQKVSSLHFVLSSSPFFFAFALRLPVSFSSGSTNFGKLFCGFFFFRHGRATLKFTA